jgi:hypothetical protein
MTRKKYLLVPFFFIIIVATYFIISKNKVGNKQLAIIDCSKIEGYENFLLNNKQTAILNKKPLVGYYIDSLNNVSDSKESYTIYNITCTPKDTEAVVSTKAVLIYSNDEFNKLYFLSEYSTVSAEQMVEDDSARANIYLTNGGNCWTCGGTHIIQFKDGIVKDLTAQIYNNRENSEVPSQAVTAIRDLNNDYVDELLVTENKWEFAFNMCHGCSPISTRVYEWDGQNYTNQTQKFSTFYTDNIDKTNNIWQANCASSSELSNNCFTEALQVLIDYDAIGQRNLGWNFFWQGIQNKTPAPIIEEAVGKAKVTLKNQYDNNLPFNPKG